MTLENLLAIKRLQRHEAGRAAILKLLAAARRNLADASVTTISAENRFDAAYKAILQCAMAALWAKGYRTSTSEPGHHQTAIQALPLTLALDSASCHRPRCPAQTTQSERLHRRRRQRCAARRVPRPG